MVKLLVHSKKFCLGFWPRRDDMWCQMVSVVFTGIEFPYKKSRGACHIFLGLKGGFVTSGCSTSKDSQALEVQLRVLS